VTLPDPTLDERSFQDLVSEARGRLTESCPEWTEHNVSDPGVTLIETFAWMTEMLGWRLNRMPERLHVALLNLLGIELEAPSAAQVDLRFGLAAPAEQEVRIRAHETEVTPADAAGDAVVFRVREDFVIRPVRPAAFVLQRAGTHSAVHVAVDGSASPDRPAFSTPPALNDAIYLGFRDSLDRLVLRVQLESTRARGAGIDPKSPPLRWEASRGADWVGVNPMPHADTTSGFNESGTIDLQMPNETTATPFAGRRLYWLRCRVARGTALGQGAPRYEQPPRIKSINARAVGALVPAEHAQVEENEEVGVSDGTAGQTFKLRHTPALELGDDETLEVRRPGEEEWEAWEQCDSFDDSGDDDGHFRFDATTGEVELGPAIRERRGAWRQYGAIPPKDAQLRMSRYRHGGGSEGDVAADTLRRLRKPIAGVQSVTNPEPAEGGIDPETLGSARRRGSLELRTRYRAVTAEDFEFLAREAPAKVGRAHCPPPDPKQPIRQPILVYVLPPVSDPDRLLTLDDLTPSDTLLKGVAKYLDDRRLVGTQLHVTALPLRGVTAVVEVTARRSEHRENVEKRVEEALYRFLNPLVGGSIDGPGEGWPCGRPLNQGDLYALVHDVPGVERVRMVRMFETDPATPNRPSQESAGPRIELEGNEVVCSCTHRVKADRHGD
jgi:predicted phage baseplate assembly protein